MKEMTILIPTYERTDALIATLTCLSNQTYKNFDVIISDQSRGDEVVENKTLQTIYRLLQSHDSSVTILKNIPQLGLAHQRDFLFNKSMAPFSLFLDDDLLLESYVLQNMIQVLKEEECGFVGCAPIGLSYKDDYRPKQEKIEFWKTKVLPEKVIKGSDKWDRHLLHSAANLYHVEQKMKLSPTNPIKYKVAWIGACVLYDTKKLYSIGGFSFWKELPANHCGEDVLAQQRVMSKYGGCGLIPTGVYHQELPTTITDRSVNAPDKLME